MVDMRRTPDNLAEPQSMQKGWFLQCGCLLCVIGISAIDPSLHCGGISPKSGCTSNNVHSLTKAEELMENQSLRICYLYWQVLIGFCLLNSFLPFFMPSICLLMYYPTAAKLLKILFFILLQTTFSASFNHLHHIQIFRINTILFLAMFNLSQG